MRPSIVGLLAGAGLALSACSDVTSPVSSPQFSRRITLDELTEALTAPTRIEIEILPLSLASPAPLSAAEVEVKGADELADEESVESPVIGLAVTGSTGTLRLALSGIEVGFGAATSFEDEGGNDLTLDQFVARIRAALDAGERPAIEAERAPPTTPAAPDDGSFQATEIELDDEADEPEVEINVDGDNLLACSAVAGAPADCRGVIKVLNVAIVLRPGTELEAEVEDLAGEVEFEGVVEQVDRAGTSCRLGTATLTDGTVIRLVEGTELEDESGDDDQLGDLCEVEAALAATDPVVVEADGKGIVEGTDPQTIVAIEVEFEIEDRAEDVAGEVEFEARAATVTIAEGSATLGTVTLIDGTRVQVDPGTDIDDDSGNDDQLTSLTQVRDALAAGRAVVVRGEGVLVSMDPRTIVASRVRFRIES